MKELPLYFAIFKDGRDPRWKKYINWMNEKYDCDWEGLASCYYGFDGSEFCTDSLHYCSNPPITITLDQWEQAITPKTEQSTEDTTPHLFLENVHNGGIYKRLEEHAKRYNSGKLRYSLLPEYALSEVVNVYTKGAHKYTVYRSPSGEEVKGVDVSVEDVQGWDIVEDGANNWRKGQNWLSSLESVQRHIESFKKGEDYDELGTLHLSNAAWGLLSLIEFYKIHPELDNRDHWYKRPFKKLYLDLDDCLVSFSPSYLKHFGFEEHEPHDWSDHRFVSRLKELKDNEEFWLNLPVLTEAKGINYPIAGYCTARSIPVEWIQKWLEKNHFPTAPILQVPFGESKVQKLKEAGCEVMLDDSIHNFVELNSNGILCYLHTRSHNAKYDVGHLRVNNLQELINRIK